MKGFVGPERKAEQLADGSWQVTVTPPAWSGFTKGSVVRLSQEQYDRYLGWLSSGAKIQNVFPEFSADQREALLSGITNQEWKDKL